MLTSRDEQESRNGINLFIIKRFFKPKRFSRTCARKARLSKREKSTIIRVAFGCLLLARGISWNTKIESMFVEP